jgi:serine/threonine protein kinase
MIEKYSPPTSEDYNLDFLDEYFENDIEASLKNKTGFIPSELAKMENGDSLFRNLPNGILLFVYKKGESFQEIAINKEYYKQLASKTIRLREVFDVFQQSLEEVSNNVTQGQVSDLDPRGDHVAQKSLVNSLSDALESYFDIPLAIKTKGHDGTGCLEQLVGMQNLKCKLAEVLTTDQSESLRVCKQVLAFQSFDSWTDSSSLISQKQGYDCEFIVMEKIQGQNVRDMGKDESDYELSKKIFEVFDIQKGFDLSDDIFRLYDKLGEMNIQPLDFKPSNVMQDIDEKLVIIDSGS